MSTTATLSYVDVS